MESRSWLTARSKATGQYRVIAAGQETEVPTYKDPDHKRRSKSKPLKLDTPVTALDVKPGSAQIEVGTDLVWIPLANLAAPLLAPAAPPPTPASPANLQPKRLGASTERTAATSLAGPLHAGSGALSGTAHQAPQRRNLPLPQGATPSSALDPLDTPEELGPR